MRQTKLLHLFALAAPYSLMAASDPETPTVRIEYRTQNIEGWTVHLDTSLLEGEHKETGDLALRIMIAASPSVMIA